MRVETITTTEGFYALRNDWDDFARSSKPASVFLRHAWFAAAWAWRQHDADLRILVAREGDAIFAILPLIRLRRKRPRRSVWTLLTVPDTQCCDLVANSAVVAEAASVLAQALACRKDWDVLNLDYLAADGPLSTHFPRELRKHRIDVALAERGRNLYIPLDGTWDRYWSTRSRSVKKASNLATNRLRRAGTVRVEHIGPGAVNDIDLERAVEATIAISGRSWKRMTGNSLDHAAPGRFIRTLSSAAQREGWLSIWLAYLDDHPVAMEYQLVYGANIHALRSDFDANLDAVSPGSFLFRHLLERLFDGERAQYLMGPGDNAYKLRWTSEGHALRRLTGYNRTVAGRLTWWVDQRAKPFLRPLRERLERRNTAVSTPDSKT
jgi:CelD/BcsL family acetyltransferase involved in cellulose biosynthesis